MTESERDEFDRNFDRLWEHLQTSATAREREPFERLLRAAWRHQPWRRRLLRLGRAPRLPPLKAESADVVPSRPRHPSGYPIEGLGTIERDVVVFHAGASADPSGYVTAGGRVLTLVALGDSMAEARDRAYRNVDRVRFQGMTYRRDLAQREVEAPALR